MMADAPNHYIKRSNVKKSTSKRRILNITRNKTNSNTKSAQNNSNLPPTQIQERRGIEAQESPIRNVENVSKIIVDYKSTASSKNEKSDVLESTRSEADASEEVIEGDAEELSKLRCASVCTEVIAEREKNRRQRCADYPGLAFGRSIFSSDTLMKFSIIRNELHNILNSQLKRAESEVASLGQRIQLLEEKLEKSQEELVTTSCKLAEASQEATECEQFRQEIEDRNNMENDRVGIIENHVTKARVIAEQADQRYEEVLIKLAQNMNFDNVPPTCVSGPDNKT